MVAAGRVEFVEEIPRTSAGKFLKSALREQYQAGLRPGLTAVIEIRRAAAADANAVAAILHEVEAWLAATGRPMWATDELLVEQIVADVNAGAFHVAIVDGVLAGTIKFQREDTLFWPDLPEGHDSAFVHRLAVRRAFAERGVSTALLDWSVAHARALGCSDLRLDCDADRLPLRRLYERFGFRYRQQPTGRSALRGSVCAFH